MNSRHEVVLAWGPPDEPRGDILGAVPEHCGARMVADRTRAEFYCGACGEVADARYQVLAVGRGNENGLRRRVVHSGKARAIQAHGEDKRKAALRLWRLGMGVREIAKALGLGRRGDETVRRWVVIGSRNKGRRKVR